ncbi:RfaG Glycosyltransferase [uncultured Caudovirales phage]|uniref:RfaG Glycosyltransferase n=1 Tax=uncultured Caudovirales phage TaxID=2100421 RepID=A0A6J5M823_9CAUD|nr:RfaG Glycosyltransferase [uncultured Caudovirales phage]
MKAGYIEKDKRKTILFLADDMRMPSGIGTMTRELILGTAHIFNYVHVGAGINHPDIGKVFDLSLDVNNEAGITDASVLLYPYNGYGDQGLIRNLMSAHKIDAIVHFTDPRYWVWLYQMSAEIRQQIPIFYYHIWDDLPAPHYNKAFYESCDLLMGISKQSVNISHLVLGEGSYTELTDKTTAEEIAQALPKTCYVPHGINHNTFQRLEPSPELGLFKSRLFQGQEVEFSILYNNRNIRRKMTSDIILAYKLFTTKLTPEQIKKTRLVMHTQPMDENGTNLIAVIDTLCPELADNIIFTNARYSPDDMCKLYNSCDTTINVGSNEGWGLSSTESMMCGTPIINNVTGGLQDQCRFEDENGEWIKFTPDFATNHTGKYKKHGKWVKPVYPAAINLQGSIPTPYIFDDRADIRDIAKAMMAWYETPAEERVECGLAGREWAMSEEAGFTAENMCSNFANACTAVLDNFVAPKRFKVYNVQEELDKYKNRKTGIVLSYE